ncbi:MAG TPA: DUF3159 domain-containing protein [Candidatus Limnocylindrales bacterium]
MNRSPQDPGAESLASLLGGRRAAIDATLGPLVFGATFAATNRSVVWAALAAVVASAAIGAWRLSQGDKPRAVVLGLLGVVVAALIVLRTGRAEDFFLIRLFTNAASALAWAVSIVIRWPLLGVVVGTLLGQKAKWRHDPVLLKAYSRASWVWVFQYVIRIIVWTPLYLAGMLGALIVATSVLTWPLVAACVAVSGWAIAHYIPEGHPGLRHPQPAGESQAAGSASS